MSVVVGYMSSREGRAALRAAVQECLLRSSDLVVVQTSRPDHSDDGTGVVEELASARRELEAAGLTLALHHGAEGQEAAEDLIDAASAADGEVIVIGLRRRSAIGKLILGSNAQRILLDARCPVLAVKADE